MPHIRIKLKQNKLIRFRDIKSLNNGHVRGQSQLS